MSSLCSLYYIPLKSSRAAKIFRSNAENAEKRREETKNNFLSSLRSSATSAFKLCIVAAPRAVLSVVESYFISRHP